MKETVLSQLAALKGAPAAALKARWRELFDTEPPAYNRRFLESRLAYRIQELAYGGLSRETLERLKAMAKQYATKDPAERKARPFLRPVAGTKLIREWEGVEHCVTVRADDFEYLGRPYKSLSSVAREITGTKWNGWVFFGLKNCTGAEMSRSAPAAIAAPSSRADLETRRQRPRPAARKLRCAVYTRKSSEEGLDMDFNSLDAQRESCEAYIASQKAEGWTLGRRPL